MSVIYRISPGIGIARVGPSTDGYFLAGESIADGCFELDGNGQDAPFNGYKDAAMLMRRQAIRFRIFQYERDDATGLETLTREITASDAEITWSVRLASTKASTNFGKEVVFNGQKAVIQSDTRRNPTEPIDSLRTEISLQASGRNFKPTPGFELKGSIMGKPIYIGEIRTDSLGRLVVLPGAGGAYNWPDSEGNVPDLEDFYDNPGWYDDIADGPVEAKLKIGGAEVQAQSAWIITAPPDFAPDTLPLTSLYDLALDAANLPLPTRLTYPQDIEPFFERAAGLAQTNAKNEAWLSFAQVWKQDVQANNNAAEGALRRQEVYDAVRAGIDAMTNYTLTKRQDEILQRYLDGHFDKEADERSGLTLPEEIDRASLDRCVGGGFYPGIEAGHTLRLTGVLTGTRLSSTQFTDWDNIPNIMKAGLLSGRMACPWHADFMECFDSWWPAQRPDITGRIGDVPGPLWSDKLVVGKEGSHPSRLNMVKHFGQLGVVIKKPDGSFSQSGRDPILDQL